MTTNEKLQVALDSAALAGLTLTEAWVKEYGSTEGLPTHAILDFVYAPDPVIPPTPEVTTFGA